MLLWWCTLTSLENDSIWSHVMYNLTDLSESLYWHFIYSLQKLGLANCSWGFDTRKACLISCWLINIVVAYHSSVDISKLDQSLLMLALWFWSCILKKERHNYKNGCTDCRSLLFLYLKWAADWLQMTYVSPNEAELVAMAEYLYQNGVQTKPLDNDDVPPGKNLREPSASIWRMRHSIQTLLDMGLQYIILTMGSHGAVLCSANTKSCEPPSRWNAHTCKSSPAFLCTVMKYKCFKSFLLKNKIISATPYIVA